MRIVALVMVVAMPSAFADDFVATTDRASATCNELSIEGDPLSITFLYRDADADGKLGDWSTDAKLDAFALRCMVRQYQEILTATAEPATLDGLLELARGHLFIGLVDSSNPSRRIDTRGVHGVTVDDDGLVISAALAPDGCTVSPAPRIASAVRELIAASRASSINDVRAASQTLLGRVKSRMAKRAR